MALAASRSAGAPASLASPDFSAARPDSRRHAREHAQRAEGLEQGRHHGCAGK